MHKTKMYACIVFFEGSDEAKKWKYVTNLKRFSEFLSRSHPSWKYFNVYDKGTAQYLTRFHVGNVIPKLLGMLLLLLTLKFTFRDTFAHQASSTTFNETTFINGFIISATIPTQLTEKNYSIC